jgi:nucleotidyltransferase substrate binding protein (TIGR01987 family)
MEDIRWEQRFYNYIKALRKLKESVDYINQRFKNDIVGHNESENEVLVEIIKEGLIQRFEYTHELAWNVMKDFAIFQGNPNISGSRDATREALQLNLIKNGNIWMDMIQSRNKTSHTYNEETAQEIYTKIISEYFPEMLEFKQEMEIRSNNK